QSGTLTFAAGITQQTITISAIGDTTVEPDETFNVDLSNPSANAAIGTAPGRDGGDLLNDDFPTLSIGNASHPEGDSATTAFIFTVSLSATTASPATVQFATADGTATVANGDYAAQNGTLTFAAGTTTQTITISVVGDTTIEPDETFKVNLSNASANT